jgi:hypothetical protein
MIARLAAGLLFAAVCPASAQIGWAIAPRVSGVDIPCTAAVNAPSLISVLKSVGWPASPLTDAHINWTDRIVVIRAVADPVDISFVGIAGDATHIEVHWRGTWSLAPRNVLLVAIPRRFVNRTITCLREEVIAPERHSTTTTKKKG